MLRHTLRLLLIVFVAIGVILTLSYFIDFSTIKSKLDIYAVDKAANSFTADIFRLIKLRLYIVGALIIGIGTWLIAFQHWLFPEKQPESTHLSIINKTKEIFANSFHEENQPYTIALTIIVCIGMLFRTLFLFQPMRWDESYTFFQFVSRPLMFGLSDSYNFNNHLLHTILAHLAFKLFGSDPWMLRLPVYISGILLIPSVYAVSKIMYGKNTAIIAASFISISSILTEYSTNARGYSILVLLCTWLIGIAALLQRSNRRFLWILFIIIGSLGLYTIPIMLYPLGGIFLWILISITAKKPLPERICIIKQLTYSTISIGVLTLLLYTPTIAVSGLHAITANEYVRPLAWNEFFSNVPRTIYQTWLEWNRDIPFPIPWILLGGFFFSLICHYKLGQPWFSIFLVTMLWCTVVLLFQRVNPWKRVWLFFLPLYFIMASAGITHILYSISSLGKHYMYMNRLCPFIAIFLCIFLGLIGVRTQSVIYANMSSETLLDAEQISLRLKNLLHKGDGVVIICPSNYPLLYYFYKSNISLAYFYFNQNINASERVIVILNKSRDVDTFSALMNKAKISPSDFNQPYTLENNKYSKILIADRKRK